MIRSIRLVNWRSHADSKLEFRKGTNLLVGIMGAGKSSILEGISFALFGTFPALERRKLKQDDIVRLNEGTALVELEFEWDGSLYKVERRIERSKKGTSSHSEIYKGGTLAEHGTAAVNSYIEQLTGVDYDLYTRAIYSEQNNIDHFLNLDPKRRKEELDRLLGLDRFEAARANIVSVINTVRARREAIEGKLDRDRAADLAKSAGEKERQASESETALKSIQSSAAKLEADYSAISARFEGMRRSREAHERLAKEEVRLGALCESMAKELEGKEAVESKAPSMEKELEGAMAAKAELQAAMKEMDGKAALASRELGSAEAAIKVAEEAGKRLAALEKDRAAVLGGAPAEELARRQKEAEGRALASESELKSLEREALETARSMESLKPGLSKCPVCDAGLTDSGIAHLKEEKEKALKGIKERSAALASALNSARKENEALLASIRKESMLAERINTLAAERQESAGLQARKAAAESALGAALSGKKEIQDKLEARSSDCERLRNELSSLRSLIERKKVAVAASKKLDETRAALSALGFVESAFEEARSEAERLRLEREKVHSARREAEAGLKACRELLKGIRDELARMADMEESVKGLYSLEEQLVLYRNALSETQVSLRSSLSEAINSAMNEIWSIFYPYRNYHGLRLSVSEKDYVFEVDDGNGWRGLETVASGGERASAALALRVALAMILTPKLSWLILDEPTHNLDSEAVELLSSALQFKVPEVVKQTFVITHDEAFMGSDFAASYRLSRDKERNGETKVEPM